MCEAHTLTGDYNGKIYGAATRHDPERWPAMISERLNGDATTRVWIETGSKSEARANYYRYKQNDSGHQLITHVGF
jgi:hypothetical protein